MPNDDLPANFLVAYPEQGNVTIPNELVRDFCTYCLEVKPDGDWADRADFDPFKLRPWLGYIIIVEFLEAENDFRYRMYGTRVSDQTDCDMTGRLVSDYDSDVRDFNMRLYHDCVSNRRIVYSEHTRLYSRYDCDWCRVICPVKSDAQIQAIACNYPVERPKPSGDIN